MKKTLSLTCSASAPHYFSIFLACLVVFSSLVAASQANDVSEQLVTAANNDTKLVQLRGKFTQGGMIVGKVPPGATVMLDNHKLDVSTEGDIVFGFSRDDGLAHQLTVTDGAGRQEVVPIKLKKRRYRVQRVNGVPKRTVEPPSEELLARIRAETAQVKGARGVKSSDTHFTGRFRWPITGRITGVYGSQRVYNGKPGRPHYGVDIAAPQGAKVRAPADGTVSLVHDDMFYSGGTLIVDHGMGISSTFIHLSKVLVKKGQKIKQGEAIAEVGSTGRSTGPHLDWRINWYNKRLDASLIVPPMPKK